MLELSIFTMKEWLLHVKVSTEMNKMKSRLSSPTVPLSQNRPRRFNVENSTDT